MDPTAALYMIGIKGQVGASVPTAFWECGHVGRCDSSPGGHATAHFRSAGHPVIRSYEPGEDWYWCYLDQSAFELQGAPPAPSHP